MGDDIPDPYCNPDAPVAITFDEITSAAYRIKSGIKNTECIRSEHLSNITGMEIYIKKEFLQATGSFKERGARYAMMKMSPELRSKGIVAASAGNHAQACCYHGLSLGVPVTVVMPETAPIMKIEKCKNYKGNVIVQGKNLSEAKRIALEYARDNGMMYLNGYDHPQVLAGQGTIGLEVWEQIPDLGAIIVPVGGGGLLAGICVAMKALDRNIMVIGVEPERAACLTEALKVGKPVEVQVTSTLADGLAVAKIGVNSLESVKNILDKCVTVKEQYVALAILRLVEYEKSIVEGAGASSLACILQGTVPELMGKKVCLVLSGGNIDTTVLGRVLERGLAADGRLVKVKIGISDRVGGIEDLSNTIGGLGVHIKDMVHERAWVVEDVFKVEVKVICECRDREHSLSLRDTLSNKYGPIFFNGQPYPSDDMGRPTAIFAGPQPTQQQMMPQTPSDFGKTSVQQNVIDFETASKIGDFSVETANASAQIGGSFLPSQQVTGSFHPSQQVGSLHPSQASCGPCSSVQGSQAIAGSLHPSQQVPGSLTPSQAACAPCGSVRGSQQIAGSAHPSQQVAGSVHPSQQIPGSLTPSQAACAPCGSVQGSQQIAGSMHPSQQIPGSLTPSQAACAPCGSVQGSQQIASSLLPSQQFAGSVHPSQQIPGSLTPSQAACAPCGSVQGSQQIAGSVHPSQQIPGSLTPSQAACAPCGSVQGSQQIASSLLPSQQFAGSVHPSQQIPGSLTPSQAACAPCGSVQGSQQITGSLHPSQQVAGSVTPSQAGCGPCGSVQASQRIGDSIQPSQQMAGSVQASCGPCGSVQTQQSVQQSQPIAQQPAQQITGSVQASCGPCGSVQTQQSVVPSQQIEQPKQPPKQESPTPSKQIEESIAPSQQLGALGAQQIGGSLLPSEQASLRPSQQMNGSIRRPPAPSGDPSFSIASSYQPSKASAKPVGVGVQKNPFSSCSCKKRNAPGDYKR